MDSPAAFARLSMFSLYSAVLPFWKMATAIAPPIKRGRKIPMRSTGKNLKEPEWWVDHERCQNNKRWGLQGHETPHKSLNLGSVPTTSNNCHLGLRCLRRLPLGATNWFSSLCCGCVPCFAIFGAAKEPHWSTSGILSFSFPMAANSRRSSKCRGASLAKPESCGFGTAWWVLIWLSWHDLMWFVAIMINNIVHYQWGLQWSTHCKMEHQMRGT